MPASLTMHPSESQNSLTTLTSSASLRPVKHVHFTEDFPVYRRGSSDSFESFAESYKGWTPNAIAAMPPVNSRSTRHNSQTRHSSTRHTIPVGSSRRESVEGFEDIKRRWSQESLSEESSAVDDE